jgi:hypothetical protein
LIWLPLALFLRKGLLSSSAPTSIPSQRNAVPHATKTSLKHLHSSKPLKKGGLATICIGCAARRSNATRAKEISAQRFLSQNSRGGKRRVLGDTDPNVKRKVPRLAPKEPVRWDMASQYTKEQMRSKAARERENRYRRNNSFIPVPTDSAGMDLPAFSSIPSPSRTPPPFSPPPAPREAPISDPDWTNINTVHDYLSQQEISGDLCSLQGTLVSDGHIEWCLWRLLETGSEFRRERALPVQ